MDETIKKRVVGAIVLVALAVIFVPFLLEEKQTSPLSSFELEETIPVQPTQKFRSGLVPDEKTATQEAMRAESQEDDYNISDRLDLSEYKPSAVTKETPAAGAKIDQGQHKTEAKPAKATTRAASKPEKKSAAAATEKKQSVSKKGWVIQVGAFSQKSNADNLHNKLTKIGMKVYIEKGKKLYHVRIGPFSSKSKAQQHQKKVEKKTGQKGIVKKLK